MCAQESGGGPRPGKDLCQLCLGLEVPIGHLPEVQLVEFTPGKVFHRPDPVPRLPIWPQYRHDHRHTGQSTLNGPAQQPALLWSFDQGFSSSGRSLSVPVVGADGTVYVAAGKALSPNSTVDVYALDGNSGLVKWSRRIAQPGTVASYRPQVALGPEGTVYANGADNGGLAAFEPDGTLKWTFRRPGRRLANPVPAPDGRVYAMSRGEGVVALDQNGQELWAAPFVSGDIALTVVLDITRVAARDDGTVIVTGDQIWALAPDGQVLWTSPLQEDPFDPPAIGDDGRVLVWQGPAAVVFDGTGGVAGSWPTPGFYTLSRTGVTYVSTAWMLTAVDPMGTVLWSRTIAGLNGPAMTTTAIGNDGTVYIAFRPYGSPVWSCARWIRHRAATCGR